MLNLWQRWVNWDVLRKGAITTIVILGVGAFYVWHLGSLSPGLSPAEATARQASQSWHSTVAEPVNAPQRLLQYGLQAADHHGAFWMRLSSVIVAILLLSLFYLLVKAWFGRIIGVLAALMLATTPWVVLLARSATADVLLLAPIAVLLIYERLSRRDPRHRDLSWTTLVATVALSLYVPGLIWVVLAGTLVARKQLLSFANDIKRSYLIFSLVLGLILLLPLIIALIREPSLGKSLVLWPEHWNSLGAAIKATVWAGLSLVWRSQQHLGIIIGRLPILDVTQIVLAIFGVWAMWTKARRELYGLVGFIALGIVAAGLNHNLLLITLALPALAILAAAGLRYLYVEWQRVFPHNPIPKTLAIVVMVGLVALHMLFGVRYSLIAWPHTVDTRQTYVLK